MQMPAKSAVRGQTSFEYMALIALLLMLTAIVVVLVRGTLFTQANQQFQSALAAQASAFNASPLLLPPSITPVPTVPPQVVSLQLIDVLSAWVDNAAIQIYSVMRAWVGYAWFFAVAVFALLAIIGVRRILIRR